jgi:cell division protein FtsI/penicillin-binding protein 2
MVVIDANSGDILVATGSKIQANWQHDGGLENNPGSSFKLVSALGLEWAAQSHPWIEPLLAGAPAPQIDAIARQQGSAFAMNESCYPAPCQGRATDISNFKQHLPQHYSNAAGQFGVAEALSGSLNTWFTWLAEASDATLAKRQPDLLPLTPNALDEARPIMHMAHTLGFEQSLLLDGGLLAPSLSGQAAHILRTSPSQFDPIQDRSQIRWHAIGSRMQVTPLQMALVAAAIGNGHTTTARLLTQLNQQPASNPPAQALGVRLDRIRAGMKAVVEQGTAKTAFAHLPAERRGIYGKTGTVPRGQGAARRQNMSWFVGYIEPGTIEGEQRRLAFAVMISRTEETGGTGAARVVADWVAAVGK